MPNKITNEKIQMKLHTTIEPLTWIDWL